MNPKSFAKKAAEDTNKEKVERLRGTKKNEKAEEIKGNPETWDDLLREYVKSMKKNLNKIIMQV